MKKSFLIIGLIFSFLLLGSPEVAAQISERVIVELTNPDTPALIDAGGRKAILNIIGYDGKEIIVEATVLEPDELDEDDEGFKTITSGSTGLRIVEDNNKVTIRVNKKGSDVRLDIKVPYRTDLNLYGEHSGTITVQDVEGTHEINNEHRDVRLLNLSGSAIVSVSHGDIYADFKSLYEGEPLSFVTGHGDINLNLPSDLKADLELDLYRGDLKSEFDIKFQPVTRELKASEDGAKYRTNVKGSINGGGTKIYIKGFRSDLIIRKNN